MKQYILFALLVCFAVTETYKEPYDDITISDQRRDFPPRGNTDGSIGSNANADNQEFRIISGGQSTSRAISTRSIDSLFSRLPSSTELDELILSADSVAILKTVQTLASDDSIPCSQIVDYLLELLGRIRVAIEKKQFAANQLQVIIEGALAEIARLEGEIDRLQDEKKALWLDELRSRLEKLVRQLEACYQNFNAVESQIAPNEARVAGFRKQIEILTKDSDEERNRIANDKLRLTEVDALIRDLENQLRDARNRREALIASISRSEAIIRENDRKIADARDKIAALEREIAALRDKADSIRRKCTDLEIQVERLRTDIAVAESKEDRINDEIDQITERINNERKKLVTDDLDDLNSMITRLKNLIPGIEREIDRQYYYCYGDGAVTIEQTGSVVVYIVRGESFGNYLLSTYGQSLNVAVRGNVNLYRVDIFSGTWVAQYGYPFGASAFTSNDLSLSGDFSCLNPSSAVTGHGTIRSISANSISVSTDNGPLNFRLGACSRIESATKVPRVGQNFAYRAVPSFAGGYNLYGGTCW